MAGLRNRGAVVVALVMSLGSLAPVPAHARGGGFDPGEVPSLFQDCGGPLPPRPGPNAKPWPERTRALRFTPEGLTVLEKLSATPELSTRLRVPGGRKGELVVEMRSASNDPKTGARSWVGRMPAGDGGELVLSSVPRSGAGPVPLKGAGRVWHGALRTDSRGRFQLRGFDGSDCLVFVRSADDPPRCGLEPRASRRRPFDEWRLPDRDPAPALESIDLLVILTPGAIADRGSEVAARAEVQLAVDCLNLAFRNSQIMAECRLVTCEPLRQPAPDPYVAPGAPDADVAADADARRILNQLACGAESWAVEARALRDTKGADLVCLVFGGPHKAKGFAYLLDLCQDRCPDSPDSGDMPEAAFSVVPLEFAAEGLVLAHEIAHSLGCCHDRPDPYCQCPVDAASFAFCFEDPAKLDDFGNALAYTTLPGRVTGSGGRVFIPIPYFSNPQVRYEGSGPLTGSADANNAATVRSTIGRVARYRRHVP